MLNIYIYAKFLPNDSVVAPWNRKKYYAYIYTNFAFITVARRRSKDRVLAFTKRIKKNDKVQANSQTHSGRSPSDDLL